MKSKVIEFADSFICHFFSCHLDKPKSFGAICRAIHDDRYAAHRARPFEQIAEVLLGGLI